MKARPPRGAESFRGCVSGVGKGRSPGIGLREPLRTTNGTVFYSRIAAVSEVVHGARAILPGMWTGLVFAGGRSERMGRDKALVPLAGRTLLERAVATLREAGGSPLVLGPPRETPGIAGVRFVDEAAEGGQRLGPLLALRHGLRACATRVAVAPIGRAHV